MSSNKFIIGKVVRGIKKGTEIGYPTINIQLEEPSLDIEFGIYTCHIFLNEKKYDGVMHFGNKTIGTKDMRKIFCEVHIFGFLNEIYGEGVKVQLLKKIRNVREFKSEKELQKQIEDDIKTANQYFKND